MSGAVLVKRRAIHLEPMFGADISNLTAECSGCSGCYNLVLREREEILEQRHCQAAGRLHRARENANVKLKVGVPRQMQ